jgi:perosamine synthetase
LVVNQPATAGFPYRPPPPWSTTLAHTTSSLLQNLEMRAGSLGGWVRQSVRRLARPTVRVAQMNNVPTGSRHFDRRHVDLGISGLALKIVQAQDLERIVERRRRNYFFLLGRLRELSPPIFNELAAGVCPLFYPLWVPDKSEVLLRLHERGVEAVDFWRHFHPSCSAAEFPEVARMRRRILEVPCHQDLGPDQMAHIAAVIHDALQASKKPSSPRPQPKEARP